MDTLTRLLLTISNALLVPNICLLFAFFAMTVLFLGGMAAEAVERRRRGPAFRKFIQALRSGSQKRVSKAELPPAFGFPAKALRETGVDREKLMDDTQLECERLLGRLILGVRLGPILGLAGTLIPLGPALVALSSGDIAMLSSKLVVAFTTTVLGLIVGGACFAMHAVRRRWYLQDLSDIEFVLRRVG